MSMDSNGKIIFAKHSEIQQANLKNLSGESVCLVKICVCVSGVTSVCVFGNSMSVSVESACVCGERLYPCLNTLADPGVVWSNTLK